MISTKTLFLTPIWGIALVCVVVIARVVGPDFEEQTFPVITGQSYTKPVRTLDYACWLWSYTKQRNVTLERKSLFIERADGIRFPVAEMRPDLGIPSNNSTTAKAGVTRTIPECVAIPAALRDTSSFVVSGVNVYRPWHGLWSLDQPVVPVVIDVPAKPTAARQLPYGPAPTQDVVVWP